MNYLLSVFTPSMCAAKTSKVNGVGIQSLNSTFHSITLTLF